MFYCTSVGVDTTDSAKSAGGSSQRDVPVFFQWLWSDAVNERS